MVVVWALPSGAPSCFEGIANPQATHLELSRNPIFGPISRDNFVLYMDNVRIPLRTVGNFTAGDAHTIHINSTTGVAFKGILLLLSKSGVDTNGWLRPVEPLKTAEGCIGTQIAGVTHQNPDLKTNGVAILQVEDKPSTYFLDINIVIVNNVSSSIYYYSQYELNAIPNKSRNTMSPTRAPTKAPIKATNAPIITTTRTPTRAPTVSLPTVAPSSNNKSCGLFGWSIFCPLTRCGWIGRRLRLCY